MNLQNQIASYLAIFMSVASSISFLLLVDFIVRFETLQRKLSFTYKNLVTPFNLSLGIISLSLIALYILLGMACQDNDASNVLNDNLVSILIVLFSGTVQFCFVLHSWQRSKLILKRSTPNLFQILTYVIGFSPIVFYTPVATEVGLWLCHDAAVSGENSTMLDIFRFTTPAIVGVALVVLDTLFLHAYTRYIHSDSLSEDGHLHHDHPEYLTISFYGQITCIVCYVASAIYVVGVCVPALIPFRNLMIVLANTFLMGGFLSMFGLKRALFSLARQERERSDESLKRSIERAGRALSASVQVE